MPSSREAPPAPPTPPALQVTTPHADAAGPGAVLVGVHHDAGVAQRGRLDRVLGGEERAEQLPAVVGQLGPRVDPLDDPVGVAPDVA